MFGDSASSPWPQSRRAGWPSFGLPADHIPPSLSPIAITRVSSLASFNILILFVHASHVIHLGAPTNIWNNLPQFPISYTATQCGFRNGVTFLRVVYNGHDGVSNHQPPDCLINRLFGLRSKKISKLRVTGLCAGDRWMSRTNGQKRGKCFHLMKSSWTVIYRYSLQIRVDQCKTTANINFKQRVLKVIF